MPTHASERRTHPRTPAPDIPLRIGPEEGNGFRVRDLSKSGVAFFSESSIPLMTLVQFTLEIPDPGGDSRQVFGQGAVVRCEPLAPSVGHFEVALFFQDLEDEAARWIGEFVASKPD